MATGPASQKLNFSTIQAFHASQSALEAVDKANVLRFLNVKTNGLEAALYTWAAGGFVEGAEILTLPLNVPAKCAFMCLRNANTHEYRVDGWRF